MAHARQISGRRQLLKFLASSPLVLAAGGLTAVLKGRDADAADLWDRELEERLHTLITSPAEAINVFDFETVAQANLPPAHWGYLATGVESDATLHANREAFSRLYLRPRRLVDVSRVDMRTELFGATWSSPKGSEGGRGRGRRHVRGISQSSRVISVISTSDMMLNEVLQIPMYVIGARDCADVKTTAYEPAGEHGPLHMPRCVVEHSFHHVRFTARPHHSDLPSSA